MDSNNRIRIKMLHHKNFQEIICESRASSLCICETSSMHWIVGMCLSRIEGCGPKWTHSLFLILESFWILEWLAVALCLPNMYLNRHQISAILAWTLVSKFLGHPVLRLTQIMNQAESLPLDCNAEEYDRFESFPDAIPGNT